MDLYSWAARGIKGFGGQPAKPGCKTYEGWNEMESNLTNEK